MLVSLKLSTGLNLSKIGRFHRECKNSRGRIFFLPCCFSYLSILFRIFFIPPKQYYYTISGLSLTLLLHNLWIVFDNIITQSPDCLSQSSLQYHHPFQMEQRILQGFLPFEPSFDFHYLHI